MNSIRTQIKSIGIYMNTQRILNQEIGEREVIITLTQMEAAHVKQALLNYAQLLRRTVTPDAALVRTLYVIGNSVAEKLAAQLESLV
jgi:hypothetical protein